MQYREVCKYIYNCDPCIEVCVDLLYCSICINTSNPYV